MTTRTIPSTVSQRGQFYVTTVNGVEYKTNLLWRGLWREDSQIRGTAQVSFASPTAFRREALRRERD